MILPESSLSNPIASSSDNNCITVPTDIKIPLIPNPPSSLLLPASNITQEHDTDNCNIQKIPVIIIKPDTTLPSSVPDPIATPSIEAIPSTSGIIQQGTVDIKTSDSDNSISRS